jgi:hypothetical protein
MTVRREPDQDWEQWAEGFLFRSRMTCVTFLRRARAYSPVVSTTVTGATTVASGAHHTLVG